MKKIVFYALSLLCALSIGSCEKDPTGHDGEGAVRFSLNLPGSSRADAAYPWSDCAIRVYKYTSEGSGEDERSRELVRRYASTDEMPESMWLLAGDYAVSVELGSREEATFDRPFYRGEKDFTIVGGQTVQVAVECRIANTIVEVVYDKTVTDLFTEELWTNVSLQETYDHQEVVAGRVPYLQFKENGRGYFTLPDGLEAFSWRFRGVGSKDGEDKIVMVDKTKHISTLPGMCYTLKFKYSPDLGGGLLFTIDVEATWHEYDDAVLFAPDPQISGDGFEIDERQEFVSGAITYHIASIADLAAVEVRCGDRTWPVAFAGQEQPTAGVTVSMSSASDMLLTLGADFFAQLPGGDLDLTLYAQDEDGRESEKAAKVRTQGVFDLTVSDAWFGRGELKAYVFDASASDVKILYRRSGTEAWTEAAASATAQGGVYAAQVADMQPNTSYECQLQFGQKPVNGASEQRIEVLGPQIPNAGLETWSGSSPLLPYGSDADQWWDSGNHGSATLGKNVTTSVDDPRPGSSGTKAACLNSQFVGLGAIGKFAAGNIFFGKYGGTNGTNGVIGFGKPFEFTYRPRQLTFWYKGTVGTVDNAGGPVSKGDSDVAQVYVCLCKMGGPHIIDTRYQETFFDPSGKTVSYCSGTLDKSSTNDRTDGKIIAWAEWTNTQSMAGWTKITLDLTYNEEWEGEVPTYLMLTASASKYGDYFAGSEASVMYLDDFELVY